MISAEAGKGRNSLYDSSDCPYSPNDLVPISGVYEICHKDESRAKALLLRRDLFPICFDCGDDVRYKLIQATPHISEDPDFEA